MPEHRIPIVNILGMTEEMTSPGAIVFEREGRTWRLDAILEAPGDRELFVMFSDATSAKQTYGAGRFLYVGLPNADRIEADFDEAQSAVCIHGLRELPAAAATPLRCQLRTVQITPRHSRPADVQLPSHTHRNWLPVNIQDVDLRVRDRTTNRNRE